MASVDIAIPSYQYGHYLADCVNSVLGQGIADLRVLIIDNASTDNSLAVARALAAGDARVELRARSVNLGPHASFNEGVDWARADYFMVLCADDRIAPGALKRAVDVLERNPAASFAHGRAISVFPLKPQPNLGGTQDAAWRLLGGLDFIARFCRRGVNHISGCTALVRTSFQKKAGHYRVELPHTDDFELWMRLAALGPVAETDAVQGISLIHGANQSSYYHAVQTRDLLAMKDAFDSFFSREGSSLPGARKLHGQAVASVAERAYWSAISHLCRGKKRTAASLFKLAFSLRPRSAVLPPVNYLLRMDRPLRRITQVLAETGAGSGLAKMPAGKTVRPPSHARDKA